jgi:hypothetical protein
MCIIKKREAGNSRVPGLASHLKKEEPGGHV